MNPIAILMHRRIHQARATLTADIVEASPRALWHVAVVRNLGDFGKLPLGDEVDARAIDRPGDRSGEIRAVVAGVVPRQPAFVEAILPEADGELHGLDRRLAADDDLAFVVDLGATEAPGHRVGPVVRIAEAVAKGLTQRAVLLLELDPDLAQLVPGVRELAGTGFLEPVVAIRPGRRSEERRVGKECRSRCAP